MKLLKGYFSMFINHKVFNTKFIANMYRKRSSKKIFVGKGELKHTNSKVIITFYVYNTEKFSLKSEYIKLYRSLYFLDLKRKFVKVNKRGEKITTYLKNTLRRYILLDNKGNIAKDLMGNEIITYNRPYTSEEFLESPKHCKTRIGKKPYKMLPIKQITYIDLYCSIATLFIDKLTTYFKVLIKYHEYLSNLVKIKVLNDREKFFIFINKANSFNAYNYPDYNTYQNMADKKYKENLYRLRYLLKFNSVKFEVPFIVKLRNIVEKLYNKKIEFNIVNLKKMHLSSDILTQAVVLKLKNRKNVLYHVLRSSLNKVKLLNISRLSEKSSSRNLNKNDYLINKIRNTYIKDMLSNNITEIDSLNNLLLEFFPSANNLKIETNLSTNKHSISLKNYVFRYLKHFKLAGVRLEAKGRLTKRFKASRSVFKLVYKGGLKNVDSSFKGLSAVMLRGDAKSNVEYTLLRSKNRIGAFGIKG
jgi:hypothetical protein